MTKKNINNILKIVMLASFVAMAVFVTYNKLSNPDMTEARLFLTYWRQYASLSVVFIASAIGVEATK